MINFHLAVWKRNTEYPEFQTKIKQYDIFYIAEYKLDNEDVISYRDHTFLITQECLITVNLVLWDFSLDIR